MSRSVRAAHIPATKLEEVMKRAGVPTTPPEIGVSADFYTKAVRSARYLRDRYTCLDLADDAGLLARMWPD
jgi:glycerol-1-phosphate dehydrogenase [NAD(P)+]